ncbi:hypothetical protein BGX27_003262 [Mortierella sp. AM989]|nr:hypothetical protein BGX27_003262 [Mortierella sp. AM989]
MSISTLQTSDNVRWLCQEYSPWCLLHMLLKNHTSLFSTSLLEDLLEPLSPPGAPTPYSSISSSSFSSTGTSSLTSALSSQPVHSHLQSSQTFSHAQSQATESPVSTSLSPKAILSRYLVQRLHFGYYGDRDTISESAVRYLTARARLQFGYFVIHGRAFWNVSSEDLGLQYGNIQVLEAHEQEGQDGKTGDKAGQTLDQHRRQRRHQPQSQQGGQHRQGQAQGQIDESDPGANKDEDPHSEFLEASTLYGRTRGKPYAETKLGEPDEEEQRKRIANGNQRCEEREEKLLLLEAVRYIERRQPELIDIFMKPLNSAEPISSSSPSTNTSATSDRQAAATYWTRVALTKLIDEQSNLEKFDIVSLPSSPFLSRRSDSFWMEYLKKPPMAILKLKDPMRHTQPHGGMGLVQDDGRLFQTASGIFNDLATHPKRGRKPAPTIIDGPFSYSFHVIKDLIVEYGYMPLPEDDADRKMNFKGGVRAATGEAEVFPSDGSHIAKVGQKGEGTSIWYFYELQKIEVMVGYLIHRAPEVLDLLFQRGFELLVQSGPGFVGLSRALLLQCCIPGCHAMVRHVYLSSVKPFVMPSGIVVRTIKKELMGLVNKPKRIEFQQQDFADVLKGLAPGNLSEAMKIMVELGMEHSVIQNRLIELLQIPGGLAPVDILDTTLTILFQKCIPESEASVYKPPMTAPDVVNLAMQTSFEIQMELPEAMDLEWKCSFEEILVNLERESLIVHNHVSDWILATLNFSQAGFQICFDHAILEALLGMTGWNLTQLKRLRTWIKTQEKEARMKSNKTGRQWEDIKGQLLIMEHGITESQDSTMQGYEENGKLIGLEIEWTTNDQITLATSAIIDSLPKASGMVRISDDGRLLLDNGYLARDHILFNPLGDDSLVVANNKRAYRFLKKNAVVEEKHWIWLAMGLVTVSLQGQHVVEMQGWEMSTEKNYSFPVKMACSPEAYQLVWMMVLAYVRQPLASERKNPKFEWTTVSTFEERLDGDPLSSLGSSPVSQSSSPVPQSSTSKIRELQRMLTDRLGGDAWLLVEILSELEIDVEKQLLRER